MVGLSLGLAWATGDLVSKNKQHREHIAGLGMVPFPVRTAPSLVAVNLALVKFKKLPSLALDPMLSPITPRDSYAMFRKITGITARSTTVMFKCSFFPDAS